MPYTHLVDSNYVGAFKLMINGKNILSPCQEQTAKGSIYTLRLSTDGNQSVVNNIVPNKICKKDGSTVFNGCGVDTSPFELIH